MLCIRLPFRFAEKALSPALPRKFKPCTRGAHTIIFIYYLLSFIFFSSHCSAMRRNSSSRFAGTVNATRTVCGSVCRAASISPAYYTSVSKKAMYRGSVRICSSRPTL